MTAIDHARADLLGAIRSKPDDDAARLVYADWLEEHDRPAEARRIRAQCAIAASADPDVADVAAAQDALPDLVAFVASTPLRAEARELAVVHRRGMPWRVQLLTSRALSAGAMSALGRLAPAGLDELSVRGSAPSPEALDRLPAVRRLRLFGADARAIEVLAGLDRPPRALTLDQPARAVDRLPGLPLSELSLRVDGTSPSLRGVLAALPQLRALKLSGHGIDHEAWSAVPVLRQLERLELRRRIPAPDLPALAGLPLVELDLWCKHSPGGLARHLPSMPTLQRLKLETTLDDADLARLVEAAPRLRTLRIVGSRQRTNLERLGALRELEQLSLWDLTADDLATLAECAPRIRRLGLVVGDGQGERLGEALAAFPRLEVLALRGVSALPPLDGCRRLRRLALGGVMLPRALPGIEYLTLNSVTISDELATLRDSDVRWLRLQGRQSLRAPFEALPTLEALTVDGTLGQMTLTRARAALADQARSPALRWRNVVDWPAWGMPGIG